MSNLDPTLDDDNSESQKIQVLHNRVIPGSIGTIEQLIIANHAVVVVASTSKKGRVKASKRGVSVGGADLEVILTGLHCRVNTVRHLLGGEALVYGALVLNKVPKADVVVQNTIPIGSATAIFEYVTQQHMAAPPRNLKAIAYDLHGIFVEMETFGVA